MSRPRNDISRVKVTITLPVDKTPIYKHKALDRNKSLSDLIEISLDNYLEEDKIKEEING